MKFARVLSAAANSAGSIYKIVFTGLLLYELVKFQLKRKSNAGLQDSLYRPRDSSYRAAGSLGLKKKGRA